MRDVTEAKPDDRERLWESTKRRYIGAAALIIVGLAVAGSFDRSVGGVIMLAGWIAGILGLHRLGRAGSTPRE
jgi:hypothetical protein